MMSGSLLKVTVTVCAVLAAAVAVAAALLGHASAGMGVAAGLLLGSLNGYLIQSLLGRGTPFVAGSLLRLVMFSAVALLAALLLRGEGWSVPLGIGVAQLVMVGAGVRQGLRA
ncbi:MAG TPA: hypothetical protein VLU92_09085 [Candidatus Dormibacteraeota bacterium]|nr:hypothetical protein [Candidatus Dormibacteraeota bacterium]